MSRQVKVNVGQVVGMPDGIIYTGPATVTLTDAQFAQLNPISFTDGTLTDLGTTGGPGTNFVTTLTAADGSIILGGTPSNPTVAVGQIPESKVTNLVSDLATRATGITANTAAITAETARAIGIENSKLAGLTAANATIVIGGTATRPTVGIGVLAEANITNLVADLAAKATTVALVAETARATAQEGLRALDAGVVHLTGNEIVDGIKTFVKNPMSSAGGLLGAGPQPLTSPLYVQSRVQNLVTNGNGILGNNYNFSSFTFDPANMLSGGGSFKINVSQNSAFNDEYIPVDPTQMYSLSAWGMSGEPGGANYAPINVQYLGICPYDIDLLMITPNYFSKFAGSTDTTLAVALNPGDTTMTLANATGWKTNAGQNPNFIWWPYTNLRGYSYPTYTYSRNGSDGIGQNGALGAWTTPPVGNVITLRVPWAGPALPVNTPVRCTDPGGTFKYVAAQGVAVPNAWTFYSGTIGGIDNTGSQNQKMFPPGTSYVRLVFLINYQALANNNIHWNMLSFGVVRDQIVLHGAPGSTTSVPLTVNAPTGQATDLQQWQVNSTVMTKINALGQVTAPVFIGPTAPSSYLSMGTTIVLYNQGVSNVPLIIGAVTGQTADLQQWQVNGSTQAAMSAGGVLKLGGNGGLSVDYPGYAGWINIGQSGSGTSTFGRGGAGPNTIVPLTVNAATGQTADLQQWQVNGSLLAKVDNAGRVSGVTLAATGGAGVITGYVQDPSSTGPYFTFGSAFITALTRTINQVPLVCNAPTGVLVSLQEWQVNNVRVAGVYNTGGFLMPSLMVLGVATGSPPIIANAMLGQTADIQQWQLNGAVVAKIRNDGLMAVPYLTDTLDTGPFFSFRASTMSLIDRGTAGGQAALAMSGAAARTGPVLQVNAGNIASVPFISAGISGQTADLIQAYVLGALKFSISVAGGPGFYGHTAPAQPAAPVTLADVIAIVRGCGLSA